MRLQEVLIIEFGWTENEIKEKQHILKRLPANGDIILRKAKFFQEEFSLSREEFAKALKRTPTILGFSEELISSKIELFQQELNLSKTEFVKMFKISPSIITYSEETVRLKFKFYQEELNLDKNEFVKILKFTPQIMSISEEYIKNRIHFLQSEFEIDRDSCVHIITLLPTMLEYSESYIREKPDFYKQELNLDKKDFVRIVKGFPALFSFSADKIKEKIAFYKKEFNITKEQFSKMFKIRPNLISYSEESIIEKRKQVLELNIPLHNVVQNPNLLSVPKNTLKLRYLILRQVAERDEILSRPNWFMTNQNKTYARIAYLKSKNLKLITLSRVLNNEQKFMKDNGQASTQSLMDKYKLTPEIINSLELGETNTFTEEEKEFFIEEYGV